MDGGLNETRLRSYALVDRTVSRQVSAFRLGIGRATPVILARGEDGQIHASVNSCTHRGLPVCRADHGNAKRFVCPYHNWSYKVSGELVAIPQERQVCAKPDKHTLGLKAVPRIESWNGMIFGSFDEGIVSLDEYLGDMRFYLDAFFQRFPEGIEFVGAPHRWVINANWKLPVENQLGDVNHGAFLHSAIIPREVQALIEEIGHSVVTTPGHGATFRLMPEDAKQRLVANIADSLARVSRDDVVERSIAHFRAADLDYGARVETAVKALRS